MCGFLTLTQRVQGIVSRERAISALNSCWPDLSVRGQDAYGIAQLSTLTYAAHSLLSVSNPNKPQPQPRFSDLSDSSLVYNGEVFSLDNIKWVKSSAYSCDTSYLLRHIGLYGPESLSRIDGMFALVFNSQETREVITARDRYGEKPLFYYMDKDMFIASSTPFAIARLLSLLTGAKPSLSSDSLVEHLMFGSCGGVRTIFADIFSHPSGSFGTLDIERWRLTFSRFWRPPLPIENPESLPLLDESSYLAHLSQGLSHQIEAVIPPYEHGLLLSGGVDSALVAMLHPNPADVVAYTARFTDSCFSSEHQRAAQTAQAAGIKLCEVEVSHKDLIGALYEILDRQSYPIDDTSCLMVGLLSQYIGARHRVCLTGDGADELFFGYSSYLSNAKSLAEYAALRFQTSSVAQVILGSVRPSSVSHAGAVIQNLVEMNTLGSINMDQKAVFVELARQYDVEFYMKRIVLAKVDMASMLNNVECRTPFLRSPFSEAALGIPYELFVKTGKRSGLKPYLRQLLHSLDSTYPIDKPKQGFGAQPELSPSLTREILLCVNNHCRPSTYFGQVLVAQLDLVEFQSLIGYAYSNIYFAYRLVSLATYINRLAEL